jgi:hypothetical protein
MCHIPEPIPSPDYLDIAFKSATILIAAINVFFAVRIFRVKTKKDDTDKDRKIQQLKTLVLDHNLKHFYDFFDKIEVELAALKQPNLTDEQKKDIDDKVGDHFISVRRKFTDTLLSVDQSLYDSTLGLTDKLQEYLSLSMFDAGVNLSHAPKYDEIISEKLTTTKTDIIRKLFSYRG